MHGPASSSTYAAGAARPGPEPGVCDAMGWYPLAELAMSMVAHCRSGLDA
ncbi:hypothetical protein NKH18_04985 [Streptomyces sp. M10(2022)]